MVRRHEFVALAERTGLIGHLTLHVLGTALRQRAAWREAGLALDVAVDLSARNLVDVDLAEVVQVQLRESGVPACALTLETTESSITGNLAQGIAVLDELDRLGTRLSVDDFGTGHSSLAYLKRLPGSEVKIDRSFVSAVTQDSDDDTSCARRSSSATTSG